MAAQDKYRTNRLGFIGTRQTMHETNHLNFADKKPTESERMLWNYLDIVLDFPMLELKYLNKQHTSTASLEEL